MFRLIPQSILAGIFISLGCIINLKVGGPLGAFLFSFGLLAVVHYSLPLYTGKAGFCKYSQDLKALPFILLGNIIGTIIMALAIRFSFPELIDKSIEITTSRIDSSITRAIVASILCGLIMTTVVTFARQKKFIPLLVGIPLFILAGFWHSIADAFYHSLSLQLDIRLLWIYLLTVIGNFIGCVLYNLISQFSVFQKEESETNSGKDA